MAEFHDLLGLTSGDTGDAAGGESDDSTMSVVVERRHLNHNGTVHGGLVATLADSAMGRAVRHCLDEELSAVTVSMTVSYLEPAEEGDLLRATAEVRKQGRRIVVVESDVVRGSDQTAIAHAVATFSAVRG